MVLKDLLDNEIFKDLTVINKGADLNRIISTVESTETPDVVYYVPANSFIITTAMIYKNNQDKLCELIQRLNDLPCAGLGIKLGRFVDDLDSRVIDTANSLGFPLICIPMNRTLGDIYHNFLSLIWDNDNKNLVNALNIRKKFYNLIVHGASLKNMLNILGYMINKHLLIIDMFGEICCSFNTSKYEDRLATEWTKSLKNGDNKYLHKSQFVEINGRETQIYIYSIKCIDRNTHHFFVFDSDDKSAISSFIMEEIMLILGMYIYKNMYIYYNEMQFRDNFLKMIVKANNKEHWFSEHILIAGQDYGLKSSSYYRIIICEFNDARPQKFQIAKFSRWEEEYILIYNYIKRKIRSESSNNVIVLSDIDKWRFILLQQNDNKLLDNKLKGIYTDIKRTFDEHIIFAYGSDAFHVSSITNSYWSAMGNLNTIEGRTDQSIFRYKSKNVLELLESIPDSQIDDVCRRMLKEFAFPDDKMNMELRETLKMYLDCNCSIVETANRLYLHRNTVRYRIKKCEEMLGNDLNDFDYCFQLKLCFTLCDAKT